MKLALPSLKRFVYAQPGRASVIERWVVVIGLAFCLLGVLGLLRWGPSDPVRNVRVDASFEGLQASMLWPHLQPLFGQDLLAIDMSDLAAELEAQPWIERVKIRRVWPDTLVIDLNEATAFARWQGEKGKQGFVTAAGHALEAGELDEPGLLYVGKAEGASEFMDWQAAFAEQLKTKPVTTQWVLSKLQRSDYGQWRAYLVLPKNQQHPELELELRMGLTWDTHRWERLVMAWQAGLSKRAADIAYIDLRYQGGMAVGWQTNNKAKKMANARDEKFFNFFDLSLWGLTSLGA